MWWFLYNPAFYGILEVEAEINATLERIATLGKVFLDTLSAAADYRIDTD